MLGFDGIKMHRMAGGLFFSYSPVQNSYMMWASGDSKDPSSIEGTLQFHRSLVNPKEPRDETQVTVRTCPSQLFSSTGSCRFCF